MTAWGYSQQPHLPVCICPHVEPTGHTLRPSGHVTLAACCGVKNIDGGGLRAGGVAVDLEQSSPLHPASQRHAVALA